MTNLTTAAGFATFIITNSELLKEFGIISSLSIVALFFYVLSSFHLLQLSTCSKKAPETFESQLHKSSWLD
jgi:predicted RND superfamily exporter protein